MSIKSSVSRAEVQKLPGCEIITRPNELLRKVGGGLKANTEQYVAQVDAALKRLSNNFAQWLEQELVSLEAARGVVRDVGLTPETASTLMTRALDLKGLGVTYGYPLVSRIAASLFKLLDEADPAKVPVLIVDAHIDGMRAVVRGDIREATHEVGKALAEQLEQRVRDYAGTQKGR